MCRQTSKPSADSRIYSFGARLAAKEVVLLGDARRELDQSFSRRSGALSNAACGR